MDWKIALFGGFLLVAFMGFALHAEDIILDAGGTPSPTPLPSVEPIALSSTLSQSALDAATANVPEWNRTRQDPQDVTFVRENALKELAQKVSAVEAENAALKAAFCRYHVGDEVCGVVVP